jgi:hypothetical protein
MVRKTGRMLRLSDMAPADLKDLCQYSTFGCMNCLWNCCECEGQLKYEPRIVTVDGQEYASCKHYDYCD